MTDLIYLDNAATTYPKSESVYRTLDKVNRELAVNAGRGAYRLAQEASRLIDNTKEQLITLINSDKSSQVIFSPSVTIAINQIINGIEWHDGTFIYVSPFEHNAVARTLHYLAKWKNIHIKELPIDEKKLEINVEKMKYEFAKEPPTAIFCTHVSNVTGYILPIKKIFNEGKRYHSINILDAAQSMGLISIDCQELYADIIAFAGHKTLYGPFGIGGFINVSGISLREFIVGGTGSDSLNLNMPQTGSEKYEAASGNIPAIAGLNTALKELDIACYFEKEKLLSEYLIRKLQDIPEITLYLPSDREQHIGIISFTIDSINSDDVGMILDEDFHIAVRTGYHCAPYIHKYLKDNDSLGTVRVSIGRYTTKEELDKFIIAIKEIIG